MHQNIIKVLHGTTEFSLRSHLTGEWPQVAPCPDEDKPQMLVTVCGGGFSSSVKGVWELWTKGGTQPLCSAVQTLVNIWQDKPDVTDKDTCLLTPAHSVCPLHMQRGPVVPLSPVDSLQTETGQKERGHLGSVPQDGGFASSLHHVKISWHHLVSSHSLRWRSSGNYSHLHVLIWLISRNKHFPTTQATWWATHLQ